VSDDDQITLIRQGQASVSANKTLLECARFLAAHKMLDANNLLLMHAHTILDRVVEAK
jgi:hypothetical protein